MKTNQSVMNKQKCDSWHRHGQLHAASHTLHGICFLLLPVELFLELVDLLTAALNLQYLHHQVVHVMAAGFSGVLWGTFNWWSHWLKDLDGLKRGRWEMSLVWSLTNAHLILSEGKRFGLPVEASVSLSSEYPSLSSPVPKAVSETCPEKWGSRLDECLTLTLITFNNTIRCKFKTFFRFNKHHTFGRL